MKKRRRIYKVKYAILYPSGKSWNDSRDVIALSKHGAIDVVEWIYSSRKIIIKSIYEIGYVGQPILEDRKVLGDY